MTYSPATGNLWPFTKSPRKVQLEALSAGFDAEGFAYFVRQRMGKTGIMGANYHLLREAGLVDYLIWVTPNSLKYAIKDALRNEWGMACPMWVYEANKRKITEDFFAKTSHGILIINYDSLQAFIDYRYANLYDHSRAMLCFDQSTEIKNPSAMRTQAALKLAHTHAYKRVMAGKPTSNGNHELWAQLRAINAVSMRYFSYRNMFSRMGGFKGKQIVGNQNTEALKELMKPYVFIAGDQYLAEFEPKIYSPVRRIELSGEHKAMYKEMERNFVVELEDANITAPIVLTKYLRLQQISSGFSITEEGVPVQLVPTLRNPRLNEVYNIVKEECDNKVLIFYRFNQSGEWLMQHLKEFNPLMIKGGMPLELLEHTKNLFNTVIDNRKVMIAQIDVAKMGHTIPGPDECPCDTIIFYENVFSLITRSEAEARPEKMGRKVPIEVIDLSCSPMDATMIKALQQKENAAMALMSYNRKYGVLNGEEANAA